MKPLERLLLKSLTAALKKGKSVLLLGPRQTGKSTLSRMLKPDMEISFALAADRQRYENDLNLLTQEIEFVAKKHTKPLIFIDEVQKIPAALDTIQWLIDNEIAQFILSGSSARKLREHKANWLPGRIRVFHLDPLLLQELEKVCPPLDDLLSYGSLPRIITETDEREKQEELLAYVSTYLEDEVRSEALVRNISDFSRFLLIAASESGKLMNVNKLSQFLGISRHTLTNYYQILEDCLIIERIEAFTQSTKRTRLTKSSKYLFFDMGVRNMLTRENAKQAAAEQKGILFEQFIGLELLRRLRFAGPYAKLYFWRDNDGPEVDWIVKMNDQLIPVEVKWTARPRENDIKHLALFLEEYGGHGYVVCQTPKAFKMRDNITAIPWQDLDEIIDINQ